MVWRLTPIRVGECDVRDYISFLDGGEATRTYTLYVWVLEGPEGPVVVDTGPSDPEGFSNATASYIPGGVRQTPDEVTPVALRRRGIDPSTVRAVVITHLHGDHYDYLPIFENAVVYVNGPGYGQAEDGLAAPVSEFLATAERLRLVGDEEILPGLSTLHLGIHSPCSQAVIVATAAGRIALLGDVAYLYDNLEDDRPPGGCDPAEWRRAIAKAQAEADHLVPGHDPRVMERFATGG